LFYLLSVILPSRTEKFLAKLKHSDNLVVKHAVRM